MSDQLREADHVPAQVKPRSMVRQTEGSFSSGCAWSLLVEIIAIGAIVLGVLALHHA